MSILIFISSVGLVASLIIHLCLLFNIYRPPEIFTQLLYLGSVTMAFIGSVFSQKTCRELNKGEFKKAILDICPHWVTITGLILMYAVSFAVINFFKSKTSGPIKGDFMKAFKGISAFPVFLYSLAILLFYSTRCSPKKENKQYSDATDIPPNKKT